MLKLLLKVRMQSWLAYFSGSGRNGAFKNKGSSKGRAVLFGVLYLYLAVVLIGMFFAMFSMLSPAFYAEGLSWFYFSFAVMVAFALMFIFSIFTAKAQLFEARDNELLLSMPIKPSAILGSRMASLLLTNFGFELLVAAPAAVAWCINCPVEWKGAAAFVLVFLALPFFSLAISSLFGWLLALLTARMRRKTLVSTVFSLCFLAAYFYIYSNINSLLSGLVAKVGSIADSVSAALPLYWLGSAIGEGNMLHMLSGLVCLVLPFVIAYIILAKTFIRTATTKRGAAKLKYVRKEARVKGEFNALLRREWARFLSSSTYIMNSGLGAIMNVILAVVVLVKGGDIADMLSTMAGIEALIHPLAVVALCVLAGMTTISACAVSLEGKNLWIVQSMPVESKKVLMAKLTLHLLISAPGMLLAQIACLLVFKPFGLMIVWMLIVPQAFNVLLALIGLWGNLKLPKLEWQNETQAVKQGFSVVIPIFGGWGILILPVAAFALLSGVHNIAHIVAGGFLVLTLIASLLLYRWCSTRGAKIFDKL